MGTDWNEFIKQQFGRITIIILMVIALGIAGFGLFTNKHIKLPGIEFNSIKELPVNPVIIEKPVYIHDTVYVDKSNTFNNSRFNGKTQIGEGNTQN